MERPTLPDIPLFLRYFTRPNCWLWLISLANLTRTYAAARERHYPMLLSFACFFAGATLGAAGLVFFHFVIMTRGRLDQPPDQALTYLARVATACSTFFFFTGVVAGYIPQLDTHQDRLNVCIAFLPQVLMWLVHFGILKWSAIFQDQHNHCNGPPMSDQFNQSRKRSLTQTFAGLWVLISAGLFAFRLSISQPPTETETETLSLSSACFAACIILSGVGLFFMHAFPRGEDLPLDRMSTYSPNAVATVSMLYLVAGWVIFWNEELDIHNYQLNFFVIFVPVAIAAFVLIFVVVTNSKARRCQQSLRNDLLKGADEAVAA